MEIKHQNFKATDSINQAGRHIITITQIDTNATAGVVDVANCHAYLMGDNTAVMTLNAVVTIARFVSGKVKDVNYSVPTNLRGTTDDYPLIVTDEVIAGVALLQAAAGRTIDGQPGASFLKFVMGTGVQVVDSTERMLRFMNEGSNTTKTDTKGPIVLPHMDAAEAVLYDYFRRITLVRNGLWSDQPGIANLTSIRRRKTGTPGHGNTWNDNLVVCWMGQDDNGNTVPRARVFLGTTEPGNTANDPTVPPQTYIMRLGYHHAQQPGGRGFRIMARDADNVALRFDRADWRGINFHSGGSTGKPANFKKGSLPGGTAMTAAERTTNLVLIELFAILSRNGLSDSQTALAQLQAVANTELPTVTAATATKVTVQKKTGTQTQTKQISVADSRKWIAETWINRGKREVIVQIINSVDTAFTPPAQFATMTATAVSALITPAHVARIIRKQAAFLPDFDDVDGLPGQVYVDILAGKRPDLAAAKVAAQGDLNRANQLLTGNALTEAHKKYIRGLKFNTAAERAAIESGKLSNPLDFSSFEIDESIGTWSVACQVVFGCEQFYRFWRHVTRRVPETGQQQWYYTVLDFTSLV